MMVSRAAYKFIRLLEFPVNVVSSFVKQDECKSLKDNILLWKLKYRAPHYYDRDLEYPWAIKHINLKSGKLLDIGSTSADLFNEFTPPQVVVYALNLSLAPCSSNVIKVQGDIRQTELASNFFDCVTCISTLEHIGVAGRYGVKEDLLGDVKAMKEMLRLLKPGGKLILTVPYGKNDVLPINKLYNKERMPKLTSGYKVLVSEYLKYSSKYRLWVHVSEEDAAVVDWLKDRWYALGMFVLQKQDL